MHDIVANENSFQELQQKRYVRYEDKPLETSDGRRIDVEFVSNVYEVDHQHVIQCNIRDITERKIKEHRLHASEYFLSQAQRIGHIGSWGWNLEGPIMWSDETYRIFGLKPGSLSLTEAAFLDLLYPDDCPAMQRWLQECAEGRSPGELTFRRVFADGSIHYLIGRGDVVRDNANGHPYMAGTVQDITERKHSEDALRQSEDRYQKITEAITDYIYSVRVEDGHAAETTHGLGCLTVTGYQPDEFANDPYLWVNMVVPEDRRRVEEEARRIPAGENPDPIEHRIIHKDGTVRWVRNTFVLHRDENGIIVTYDGLIQDITERKRAEEALRESQLRYRAMIQQSSEGIGITELNGRYIKVNPAFCTMTGYSEEELLKLCVVDLLPKKTSLTLFTQVANEREAGFREVELLRKDGTTFVALISGSALEIGANHFVQGFVQDITERKRAEEAIRENHLMLELAMSAAKMAWWEMDIPTGYISFEKRKAEMLGFLPEHFKHYKDFMALVHPEDSERAMNAMRGHLAGSLEKYEVEYRISTKSGEYKWFYDIGAITKKDVTGKPLRVAGLVINITERKHAEEALHQGQRMESIGTLAGGIAHDFNNVLGGIMGYGEMSLQYAEKDSKLEKNLRKVLKAADRAKHLIEQILTFSRKTDPKMSITSIRPIVKEVLDLLRASIPSSIIIDWDLEKNTKPVIADPTKIHEAILNLATNAVHAMNRKGTLTIKLFTRSLDQKLYGQVGEITPGEYTVIEVADTGCGMDAVTLSRAFEPFFTTKTVGEGTGMGLSVVLGIVQSIGGDIQVQSEVGKGTTFTLYLPVVEELITTAGDDESLPRLTGTERILFVDDEQMLVEMAEDMLTSLGYKVTCISNSLEALQFVKEKGNDIDLLITDQTMPGLTGIELAKEVLKVRKNIPIILCTGFSSELNPERAASIGINSSMMKPFRISEIGKAIRDALDKKRER